MRYLTAVLFLSLSFGVSAGKSPPGPDPVFVGYSSTPFSSFAVGSHWIEAFDACRTSFSVDAKVANSKQIRAAIESGDFYYPTSGIALVLPTDVYGGANFLYDPYLTLEIGTGSWIVLNSNITISNGGDFGPTAEVYMACAQ